MQGKQGLRAEDVVDGRWLSSIVGQPEATTVGGGGHRLQLLLNLLPLQLQQPVAVQQQPALAGCKRQQLH